jgi:hypothetical protein
MIIYGVSRNGGEWEDRYKILDKCFTKLKKAEEYVEFLESEEERKRTQSERCMNCSGSDRSCPLWQETFEDTDECGAWFDSYHEREWFEIEDVELIED